MNVLVVGKSGRAGGWFEYLSSGFERLGHTVYRFSTKGNSEFQHLKFKLYKSKQAQYEKYMAAVFDRFLNRKKIDICIALNGYRIPAVLIEILKSRNPGCARYTWVAERFSDEARYHASLFDEVYYTDTRFITDHRELGFDSQVTYMPHAVDTRVYTVSEMIRRNLMLYVANRSAFREDMVSNIRTKIQINGRGWRRYRNRTIHSVKPHRVNLKMLPDLYSEYLAVLNLRSEDLHLNGLGQKSFEPFGCKTPVVHANVPDIERCFEPGKEIFVFNDIEELNELYKKLLTDKALARQTGEAGYNRICASHTYDHRIKEFLRTKG